MRIIPLERLDVLPSRVRQEFDDLSLRELAESIASVGLMHPVVVRHNADSGAFELVAGERRSRAVRLLASENRSFQCNGQEVAPGDLPVLYIGNLSEDLRLEAELDENLRRRDLTWQEQDLGIARLHELRSRQNPRQTLTATADELKGLGVSAPRLNATYVRDSVNLAEHFEDPEIRESRSRDEALKRLRVKAAHALSEILAKRAERREEERFQVFNTSFEEATLKGVSVIVTDPPYGIEAEDFGSQTSTATAHRYNDTFDNWLSLIQNLAGKALEVTAASAHIYVFCAIDNWPSLYRVFDQWREPDIFGPNGWRPWPRPLIWAKGGHQGLLPDPTHGPRYTYDAILYARRGDRPVTGVYPDVLTKWPQLGRLNRAGEKPVEVYENLLRRSANPGDLVWDPCGGTGPILRAAKRLGLRAVMHEIDKDACNLAHALLHGDTRSTSC